MAKTNIQVDINANAQNFTAGTQQAADAAQHFGDTAQRAGQTAADSMNKMAAEAKDAGKAIQGLSVGGVSINDLKGAFTSAAGAGAILSKGIEALGTIAKTVMGWMAQKAKDLAESLQSAADSIREVNGAQKQQQEGAVALLKELDSLNKIDGRTNEQEAKRLSLMKQLEREYPKYGAAIAKTSAKSEATTAMLAQALKDQQKQQLQGTEAEIEAVKKQMDQARKTIEDSGFHVGSVQIGGSEATKEAQKQYEELSKRMRELQRQKHHLEKSDAAGDFMRENGGREADAALKRRKDMNAALDAEKAKLAEIAQQTKNLSQSEFNAQRDALKSKYDTLKKQLGGDFIPKESLNQLDAWYQGNLKKIAEAEAANNKAIADAKLAEQKRLAEEAAKLKKEADRKALDAIQKAAAAEEKAIREKYAREQQEARKAEDARKRRADRQMQSIDRKRGKYNFGSVDFDPLNDTGLARSRRRINYKLDQSISDKLARQEQGERVHYNYQERKRIEEAQKLDKEKKNLEEEIAQRNEQAAKTQERAAQKMEQSVNELHSKVMQAQQSINPNAMAPKLDVLHGDLSKILQKAYIVK